MAYDLITKYTSPNTSTRAAYGHHGPPTGLTVHWWGLPENWPSFDGVVSWLCDTRAGTSAHYVVEAGRVACIVSPELAAWHSGSTKGNGSTIGLELNPQCRDGDYETAAELIRDLREAYGNLPLYGHREWTATACPGNYDLGRLDRLARNVSHQAQAPTELEWSDMATEQQVEDAGYRGAKRAIRELLGDVVDVPSNQATGAKNKQWTVPNALTNIWHAANEAANLLDKPVELKGSTSGTTTLRTKIEWQAHEFHRLTDSVEALTAALTGTEQADSTDPAVVEKP